MFRRRIECKIVLLGYAPTPNDELWSSTQFSHWKEANHPLILLDLWFISWAQGLLSIELPSFFVLPYEGFIVTLCIWIDNREIPYFQYRCLRYRRWKRHKFGFIGSQIVEFSGVAKWATKDSTNVLGRLIIKIGAFSVFATNTIRSTPIT